MKNWLARIEIQLLMQVTAKAFQQKPLSVWRKTHRQALLAYAECTRDWMEQNTRDLQALQADMYHEALRLGRLVHRLTFFMNDRGHERLVYALYRGIGICMDGTLPGTVTVSSCFFSRYYTPAQCALISAMDDGIVSGIMGGGRLIFSARITEGCSTCCACLTGSECHES